MTDAAKPAADPRFQYQDITPPALPVSILDTSMIAILDITPEKQIGIYGLIVNGVRMATVGLWLWTRRELIKQQQEFGKQKYDANLGGQNQQELDSDVVVEAKK